MGDYIGDECRGQAEVLKRSKLSPWPAQHATTGWSPHSPCNSPATRLSLRAEMTKSGKCMKHWNPNG